MFGVSKLFPQEQKAIKAFIFREDVLVNLPTGFGKSLIFQISSVVHAELSKFNNTVIIVILPLVSLIEQQKNSLRMLRIKTGSVGENNLAIENGDCSVRFTLPEYLLGNRRCKSVLSSEVYEKDLIGIVVDKAHCISHWYVHVSSLHCYSIFRISITSLLLNNTFTCMSCASSPFNSGESE